MSFTLSLSSLEQEHKDFIKAECNVTGKSTKFKPVPQITTVYSVDTSNPKNKQVIIPLGLHNDLLDEFPNTLQYTQVKSEFVGELKETEEQDQQTVIKEALEKLNKRNVLLLALRTGFGKTCSGIYLISKLGLRAVILCHVTTLHSQWVSEFKKFCPSLRVKIVEESATGTSIVKLLRNTDIDVFLMGVIKASHIDKTAFTDIGLVLVDEAHLCLTETFSSALLQFSPKYLIGLSATPDRRDGMSNLLYPFFGYPEEFIVRSQKKNFKVIKYLTGIKPQIRQTYAGTLDWNHVVNSIAYNLERQKFIVDLCKKYKNDKILILSNRVCEIVGCKNNKSCSCKNALPPSYGIVPLLVEAGESVDSRVGTAKKHDETKRIVIGTYQKLSTGYDSKRSLLILISDVTDIRQAEGRIRLSDNIVIDLVDKFAPFETHYKEREEWYVKRGATIQVMTREGVDAPMGISALDNPNRKRLLKS